MARLITCGFELKDTLGDFSCPDGSLGTASGLSFVSTPVHGGVSALKEDGSVSPMALPTWSFATPALGTTVFLRTYVYIPTGGLPTAATLLMSLGAPNTMIRLETDGTLTLWGLINGTTWTQQGSASSAMSLDAWNLVELSLLLGTGTVDAVGARLDTSSFASASSLALADGWVGNFTVGASSSASYNGGAYGSTYVAYFDDVALNDSTGGSQTSWPGSGYVALLRPTADSAVGTGWTLGNTTVTGGNAWQRVDNAPPDSAADLTTAANADQIRNATSNANVNYDATMTTYTAAGVTGTVNVVVPIIATGAPVVTSAKAGTVGVVSNPTIANISLGAGGTSGAFWSGVAVGTYPTGNKWSFGTTTYAPAVTLGTAPVMRITQVTSSTRIAIVTEMGIYVDYTPAVTTLPPLPVYVDSAVARSTNY